MEKCTVMVCDERVDTQTEEKHGLDRPTSTCHRMVRPLGEADGRLTVAKGEGGGAMGFKPPPSPQNRGGLCLDRH